MLIMPPLVIVIVFITCSGTLVPEFARLSVLVLPGGEKIVRPPIARHPFTALLATVTASMLTVLLLAFVISSIPWPLFGTPCDQLGAISHLPLDGLIHAFEPTAVVAFARLLYGESPLMLLARTRYQYLVVPAKPASL